MAQYTIEDIEILRQKSGISYEEAVNLLEYHNGSLARALVDLEKNGRIKDSKTSAKEANRRKNRGVFNTLYRLRVKVTKGEITILNLSSLFSLLALLIAPWVVVIGLVLVFVLGYRIRLERDSAEFADDNVEDMFRHAGNNVRSTVNQIAQDIGATQSAPRGETTKTAPSTEPDQPASGTTPVNVQFSEDGNVNVKEDADGYHEADIR